MSDSAPKQAISAADAKRAVRNVGVLMLASVFSKGLLFIWQIILGNWIGPTELGIYSTVGALFAISAPLTGLGMGMIAIREIAKKPEQIGQYASALLFIQTALSAVAYLALVAISTVYSEVIVVYAAVAGISLVVDMFGSIGNDLLLAQEKMHLTSVMEILQIVLRVAFAAYALWAGWGLFGIYIATIIAGVIRSVSIWALLFQQKLRLEFPVNWSIIAIPMLINALPLIAGSILSLGYDHTDKLMMTGIIGETNTGYLQPAFLIHFGVIELTSTAILVAVYPLLARYHHEAAETFGFLVQMLFRFLLMLILPLAIAVTIFSDDIITTIYQNEFLPTIPILRVYIWYTFLTIISNVLAKALLIQNRQRYMLVVTIAALTLNIVVNYILLTQFGSPIGAAVASVAAQALALALFIQTFRSIGFSWLSMIPSSLRLTLIAGVSAIVMLIVGQVFWVIGAIVGGLVYLAGIIFGNVLSEADWDLLYRLTASLPGGTIIRRYWQRDTVINW